MDDDEIIAVVVLVVVAFVATAVSFDDDAFGRIGGTTGMTAGVSSEYSSDNCNPV
jgi:hypothetical protein